MQHAQLVRVRAVGLGAGRDFEVGSVGGDAVGGDAVAGDSAAIGKGAVGKGAIGSGCSVGSEAIGDLKHDVTFSGIKQLLMLQILDV